MIAFLRGGSRRLSLFSALWFSGLCATASAQEAPAPPRLEAEIGGRWLEVVSAKGELLLARDGDATVEVARGSRFRIEGDLGAHPEYVRIPDGLRIAEELRATDSTAPRVFSVGAGAGVTMQTPVKVRPGDTRSSGWDMKEPSRVLGVFAWMVDGRAVEVRVREFRQRGDGGTAIYEKIFVPESQVCGTAVFLAFQDGAPIAVVPPFASEPLNRVAAWMALGLDARAAAEIDGLREVWSRGARDRSLLEVAAGAGATVSLEKLLGRKPPGGILRDATWGALADAIFAGRPGVVKRLLGAGVTPGRGDREHDSSLHFAAEAGSLETCQALVAAGAKVDGVGKLDESPLIRALNANRSEVAEWLVGKGARFPASGEQASRVLLSKSALGQLPLVRLYLKHGATPDFFWRGETPLIAAAREGHLAVVDHLLSAGARPDGIGREGTTPLIAAAVRGRTAVVERLLAAGADPKAVRRRNTALHSACFSGSAGAVAALLKSGAEVDGPGPNDFSALTLALGAGTAESVRLLLAAGAKVDPRAKNFAGDLESALAMDSAEFVGAALAAGLDRDFRFDGGWSVLQVTRVMAAKRSAALLVAAGFSDDAAGGDQRTALAGRIERPPQLLKLQPVADPRDIDEAEFKGETVVVEAVVDADGRPRFARATCADCRLSQTAVNTVLLSKFAPATFQGAVVASRVRVPVRFLDRSELQFEVGEVDVMPSVLKQVPPVYPYGLRASGVQGRVLVEFTVDPEGNVIRPRALQMSHPMFEESAIQAILQWKFKPGTRDGKAVHVKMQCPIGFMLD